MITGEGNDLQVQQNIITNNFIELLFSSRVWFYPRTLRYLASSSWPSRKGQVWAPSHSMALNLEQPLVGHAHNLGTTIGPVYLSSRDGCRSTVWRLCWCPSPTNGILVLLQKMSGSGFISSIIRSPCQYHPPKFQEVALLQVSTSSPNAPYM